MNLLEQVAMSPFSSYRIIPLTKGQFTIIDAADYPLIGQHRWHAEWNPHTQSYYAKRSKNLGIIDGKLTIITIRMHRVILGLTDWNIVGDHRNRKATLDNRRQNLRVATRTESGRHRGISKNNTSGYKGVYKNRFGKPWYALIMVDGISIRLGSFDRIEDAAQAYNEAAIKYHKEFAPTS